MGDEAFHLPRRWDGRDFEESLRALFNSYLDDVIRRLDDPRLGHIEDICQKIIKCVSDYHCGHPSRAYYYSFRPVMKTLAPLMLYVKNGSDTAVHDPELYRLRNVSENIEYVRSDMFHMPYHLRAKVRTNRYSIAGYPCLYLGTSLALCYEELAGSCAHHLNIAARFRFDSRPQNANAHVRVIDFALRPQDYMMDAETSGNGADARDIAAEDTVIRYLHWYPLIAASSFIRVDKNDPFASEYILPQLLMQWLRDEGKNDALYGIRYFSCSSVRASNLGYNYVFPVSGKRYGKTPFCKVLAQAFELTRPVFVNEYASLDACEAALRQDTHLQNI
jgi:hypothetical protein